MATKISWCDETINPVVGCSKISEGCNNCYALKMAYRLRSMGNTDYQRVTVGGGVHMWNNETVFRPAELEKPYRWRKPRSIFISSMGDLFHESVWRSWIDDVMRMVANNSQHTFIFLTKRPERMKQYFDLCDSELVEQLTAFYQLSHGTDPHNLAVNWPLPNLVLGVTAEDQKTADERIHVLLQIPAAKRFVSIEPMLGEIDLYRGGWSFLNKLIPPPGNKSGWKRGLDGVILGGESGSKARPLQPEWVRKVRDQCAAAGVPFMFKQWGEWLTNPHDHGYENLGTLVVSGKKFHKWPGGPFVDPDGFHYSAIASMVGTKLAGRLLDGRTHSDLPWTVNDSI